MNPTKNEICFDSLRAIVPESSPDSNIRRAPTAVQLQQIRKSTFVQYNFSPSGTLHVVLSEGHAMAFNMDKMNPDIAETLSYMCLNDKTVIGYDLYTSYTLSHDLAEQWQPSCSINIPTLQRVFRHLPPLVEGLLAAPQLLALTSTSSFGDAIGKIFDFDAAQDGSFFRVCELMPQAMAGICIEAIHNMTVDDSNKLAFEDSLKTDFARRRSSLISSSGVRLLEFDLYDLPEVHHEFQLAVDNVSNALNRAWKGSK
jgi:hypothetical protein